MENKNQAERERERERARIDRRWPRGDATARKFYLIEIS